ncbi:MAG: CPBP family intramembrane metalloprotease domain-containing protein, partial [Bacillota bacterium]
MQAPTGRGLVLAYLGVNLVLTPVLLSFFALGEEIGWRGYLLPQLAGLGRRRALLLSGFLWSIWHLPL